MFCKWQIDFLTKSVCVKRHQEPLKGNLEMRSGGCRWRPGLQLVLLLSYLDTSDELMCASGWQCHAPQLKKLSKLGMKGMNDQSGSRGLGRSDKKEKHLFKSCLQVALVLMHGVLFFAWFVTPWCIAWFQCLLTILFFIRLLSTLANLYQVKYPPHKLEHLCSSNTSYTQSNLLEKIPQFSLRDNCP